MAKRIAVFASGNGSNFQVIAEQFPVEFVFSDHRDAYVLERAKNLGVASHALNSRNLTIKRLMKKLSSNSWMNTRLIWFAWRVI